MPAFRRRPLLGAVAAAAMPLPARAQAAEIRLGALFPFSGPFALLGDESFRGLEIAAEERNAAGGLLGRPLRLVRGDAVDETQAVAEVRRLIAAERLPAIFGTLGSPLAFAASQVAELQSVLYFEMSATSDPITERGFRWLFRSCPRASEFGAVSVAAVAEILAPAWGVEPAALRVAVLYEDGIYGQAISASQTQLLRTRGFAPPEVLGYSARSADLGQTVQRLRGLGIDVVLHTGYQNDIVQFFRGLQDAAWRPRMILGSGAGYSLTDTARAIGASFDGVMNVDFTQFAVNERYAPGAGQFADAYRRRYGADPRSGHSLANYFGARVFLDAIQRAGAMDRDRIRTAVLATDIAEGTTPAGWGVRFDERGQNLRARPFLLQWQDGRQVTIQPDEAAVAPVRPGMGPA